MSLKISPQIKSNQILSAPPPSAQVHPETWVLGTFLVMGKFFLRLWRMPYILLHVCSISFVFHTTMPQRSLLLYFSSPVPPLPRTKREEVIDALLYFRFKDKVTSHKRQKAGVPWRSISRGTAVNRRRDENSWAVPSSALGRHAQACRYQVMGARLEV